MSDNNTFRFARSKERRDIYDLVSGPTNGILKYVRLSKPKQDFLKRNGARYVLDSFLGKDRILFTGLIPESKNTYIGDHLVSSKGIKRILRVFMSEDFSILTINIISSKKIGGRR